MIYNMSLNSTIEKSMFNFEGDYLKIGISSLQDLSAFNLI